MTETRSQKVAADVAALLRSRAPLVWVVTREEARVEEYLIQACRSAGYNPMIWDCARGVVDIKGNNRTPNGNPDIGAALGAIEGNIRPGGIANRTAWIMRDLHKWVDGPIGATPCRQLCNLAREIGRAHV